MVDLDATLRLMDPDIVPEEILSKRPHVRTKLFGAGKLNRLIMDAMRKGARPGFMTDVVDGIVAELGYGDDAAIGLGNRFWANMRYLEKGGRVAKDGRGRGLCGGWREIARCHAFCTMGSMDVATKTRCPDRGTSARST